MPEAFRAKSPRVAFGNVLAEPLKASWSVRGVVLRRLRCLIDKHDEVTGTRSAALLPLIPLESLTARGIG